MSYTVTGSYFESCNCDPICPCRMTDGIPGGRSTHGICFGALAWLVEDGHVGDVHLSGLKTVLTMHTTTTRSGRRGRLRKARQLLDVRVSSIRLEPGGG